MISMTGFGMGEVVKGSLKIATQLTSINRKQTEIKIFLPKFLQFLEQNFRDTIKKNVSRGCITARLDLESLPNSDVEEPLFDTRLIKRLYTELSQLNNELGSNEKFTLSDVLGIPNINLFLKAESKAKNLQELAMQSLQDAIAMLVHSKKEEGEVLMMDIKGRHRQLEKYLLKISRISPTVPQNYQKKMTERLQEFLPDFPIDDERIFKEVAIFADRCDISEEITRLSCHLDKMKKLLTSFDPVGRKLDFLIQETYREINTIGAKANEYEIAASVIEFKTELERIREQIQNIE